MNNPAMLCRGNNFRRFANEAAMLERLGDYDHASRLWLRAVEFPASNSNRNWASCRADTCHYLSQKPKQAPVALSAEEFNHRNEVGKPFIYVANPNQVRGVLYRTVGPANKWEDKVFVEINKNPYFVNIERLRPAAVTGH